MLSDFCKIEKAVCATNHEFTNQAYIDIKNAPILSFNMTSEY